MIERAAAPDSATDDHHTGMCFQASNPFKTF